MWSEEDNCISALSSDMDYLTSAQRPLEQVLEKAADCLGGMEGREGESDGSESCDDDDFDEYYVEDDVDVQDTSRYAQINTHTFINYLM